MKGSRSKLQYFFAKNLIYRPCVSPLRLVKHSISMSPINRSGNGNPRFEYQFFFFLVLSRPAYCLTQGHLITETIRFHCLPQLLCDSQSSLKRKFLCRDSNYFSRISKYGCKYIACLFTFAYQTVKILNYYVSNALGVKNST